MVNVADGGKLTKDSQSDTLLVDLRMIRSQVVGVGHCQSHSHELFCNGSQS